MKKITLTLVSIMLIMLTSCEKEEVTPSKPDPKNKLKECNGCGGSWDITGPNG